MKLVKIEDVRVGQVWQDEDGYLFLEWDSRIEPPIRNTEYYSNTKQAFNYLVKRGNNLIGFLDITHEIKDGKLVEIPRAEFAVDDVIEFGSNTRIGVALITKIIDGIKYDVIKTDDSEFYHNLCNVYFKGKRVKKIGILGVTHEFVNERLVK